VETAIASTAWLSAGVRTASICFAASRGDAIAPLLNWLTIACTCVRWAGVNAAKACDFAVARIASIWARKSGEGEGGGPFWALASVGQDTAAASTNADPKTLKTFM
jgi:hypothetical protein